jgi:hypothetical protein
MGRKSASGSGIRDEQPGSYFLELRNHFFCGYGVKIFKFLNAGSSAPQTSDEIYTCTKSYGAKFEILIKLFLNVEIFHNCLKLPFFGLKIRLLFKICFGSSFGSGFESGSEMFISDTDRIRIRSKVSDPYGYGSGSGSGSATLGKSQESENTECMVMFCLNLYFKSAQCTR